MRNTRWFNLEEAHQLLPVIESVLKRMDAKVKLSEKLHDHLLMEDLLHAATGNANQVLLQEDQKHFEQNAEALVEEIQEINSLGCKIFDFIKGWIDFPAQHEGAAVFYVWKRGEADIRFYRTAQDKTKLLPL